MKTDRRVKTKKSAGLALATAVAVVLLMLCPLLAAPVLADELEGGTGVGLPQEGGGENTGGVDTGEAGEDDETGSDVGGWSTTAAGDEPTGDDGDSDGKGETETGLPQNSVPDNAGNNASGANIGLRTGIARYTFLNYGATVTNYSLPSVINNAFTNSTITVDSPGDDNTTSSVSISNKTLTLDLAGHTVTMVQPYSIDMLTMNNSTLTVINTGADIGVINLSGGIVLTNGSRLIVDDNCRVTLSSGSSSCITVQGGSEAVVTSAAHSAVTGTAVACYDNNSRVTVRENVSTTAIGEGVLAKNGAEVTVGGHVDAPEARAGVLAEAGGTVTVGGNVSGGSFGVENHSGTVVANGSITASPYGTPVQHTGAALATHIRGDVQGSNAVIAVLAAGPTGSAARTAVTIGGSVTGGVGVRAQDNVDVAVGGDILAVDAGINAADNAMVTVDGNVTTSGSVSTGVTLDGAQAHVAGAVGCETGVAGKGTSAQPAAAFVGGGIHATGTAAALGPHLALTVEGDITSPTLASFWDSTFAQPLFSAGVDDGVPGTGAWSGYKLYTYSGTPGSVLRRPYAAPPGPGPGPNPGPDPTPGPGGGGNGGSGGTATATALTTPTSPQTGDGSNRALPIAMACLSGGGLVGLIIALRRVNRA